VPGPNEWRTHYAFKSAAASYFENSTATNRGATIRIRTLDGPLSTCFGDAASFASWPEYDCER